MTTSPQPGGFVTGYLNPLLRLEGAIVFISSVFAYAHFSFEWKIFFLLFLFPDLSFIGYVFGKKIGCIAYNVLHSYVLPVTLGSLSIYFDSPGLQSISLIWIAHIGFDRSLGYGLKYASGFHDTHLGFIKIWQRK